jgi:transcriptional regulator with XRE-family HTH domain
MRQEKREKLEAAGWRLQSQLSQTALAELVQSSQSRIAKMEAGDPSVSIDLLMTSLLALGATPGDLARAIAAVPGRA